MIKRIKASLPRLVSMLLAVAMLAGAVPAMARGLVGSDTYPADIPVWPEPLPDQEFHSLLTATYKQDYNAQFLKNERTNLLLYYADDHKILAQGNYDSSPVQGTSFVPNLGRTLYIDIAHYNTQPTRVELCDEQGRYLGLIAHGDSIGQRYPDAGYDYTQDTEEEQENRRNGDYDIRVSNIIDWDGTYFDSETQQYALPGQDENGDLPSGEFDFIIAFQPYGEKNRRFRTTMSVTIDYSEEARIEMMQLRNDKNMLLGEYFGCENDPVYMVTGNFLWDYTDFAIYGARPLEFTRYYNAQDRRDGELGFGWRHSFLVELEKTASFAAVTMPDGYQYTFRIRGDGSLAAPEGVKHTLEAYNDGYLFTLQDKIKYYFNSAGCLTAVEDVNGNRTEIVRNGTEIVSVSNDSGVLYFTYTGGRISRITDQTGRFVSYTYDGSSDLVSFLNADGDTIDYTYDDHHRITEISDFNGHTYLKNTYDSVGRVIEQTLAEQGTSYFSYDFTNRVSTITDPTGAVRKYYYDANQKITAIEDVEGQITYEYTDGRVTSQTDRLGNTITYSYDASGNRTATRYPDGTNELAEYNSLNLPTKVTGRDGNETRYDYDGRGNLTSQTDAMGRETSFTYDSSNNLMSVTDARGYTTSYTYDGKGNRTSITDADDNVTSFIYDDQGRLVKQISPDGGVTTYEYSTAGKLIKVIDADGNETEYNVNGNGYDEGATDAMDNSTTTKYNKMNKPVLVTDAEGNSTAYAYDSVGNLTCTTDALGRSTFYAYDAKGRMIAMTEPSVNAKGSMGLYSTWFYEYDAEGRMVSTTDPLGYTTSQSYDNMGRTVSSTNARGFSTSYQYDAMGRTTKVTNALNYETKSEYDDVGNLIRQTDARGNSWVYEYDELNRMVEAKDPLGYVTRYEYDALGRMTKTVGSEYKSESVYDNMGRLIKTIDAEGNVTRQEYDLLGRLVKTIDAEGGETSYSYDRLGRLVTVTAPYNDEETNVTLYEYDNNGRTTKVIEAFGSDIERVTEYTYDALGRIVEVKNILEDETIITQNTYDVAGNLVAVTVKDAMTDIEGNIVDVTTRYAYDLLGRVTSTTDPNFNVTRSEYDGNGNVIKAIAPDHGEIAYTYDKLDRLSSYVDAEGYLFSFEYDKNGNTVKTTDGRGNSKHTEYDKLNRPVKYYDEMDNFSTVEYDADGRVIKRTGFDGAETTYTYDKNGNVLRVEDAMGNKTTFTYDALNRVKSTKDDRGAVTSYTYDAAGKVKTIIGTIDDNKKRIKSYEYDRLGRLIKEHDYKELDKEDEPDHVTEYTYDKLGHVLAVTNPLGYSDSFTYDKLGRIKTVTDKNGNVTEYFYDANGNIIETKDALGNSSYFAYDSMNRLKQGELYRVDKQDGVNERQITLYQYDMRGLVTREINALHGQIVNGEAVNGVTLYVYDGNGNLVSKTDADGYVTEFGYDSRNLVESINYSNEKNVTFLYDKAGRLTKMEDWNGTTTFVLDLLGRITSVNDHNNKPTSYTYDEVGNKTSMTYPDGSVVSYEYDLLGRLIKTKDAEQQNTEYDYDAASRLLTQAYPNGWKEYYEYDAAGQLLIVKADDPSNHAQKTLVRETTYDPQGNVLSELYTGVGAGQTQERTTYTYDALNRLTSENLNYGNKQKYFTYDSLGNLTYEREGNANKNVSYEHNILNQIVSKTVDGKDNYTYSYDRRGNLTSVVYDKKNALLEQYTYDATNRMVLAINDIGEASYYLYNGLGYLVGQEWVVKKNAYGYHANGYTPTELEAESLTAVFDPATGLIDGVKVKSEEAVLYYQDTKPLQEMTVELVAGGSEYNYNAVGMTPSEAQNVFGSSISSYALNPLQPSLTNTTVIMKSFVLDYTSDRKDVILEWETVSSGKSGWTDGLTYRYTQGVNRQSVVYGNGLANTAQNTKLWYHLDRLGSVRFMTQDSGNNKVACYIDYDAWGKPGHSVLKGSDRELDLMQSYTGHQYDMVLGLYFAQTRMYDAEDKRFCAVDPVRGSVAQPASMTLYIYVLNNPLKYIDPLGKVEIKVRNKTYEPNAISGTDIDGSGNIFITRDEFILIYINVVGLNNTAYSLTVQSDGSLLFKSNDMSSNILIKANYVKGLYFVKLSCLQDLLKKVGYMATVSEENIIFNSRNYTKKGGTDKAYSVVKDLFSKGGFYPSFTESFGNSFSPKPTYRAYAETVKLYSEAYTLTMNLKDDKLMKNLLGTAGKAVEVYDAVLKMEAPTPEYQVLGALAYCIFVGTLEALGITGEPGPGDIGEQLGTLLGKGDTPENFDKAANATARYMAAKTSYPQKYMLYNNVARRHFRKDLEDKILLEEASFGVLMPFAGDYLIAFKEIVTQAIEINEDKSYRYWHNYLANNTFLHSVGTSKVSNFMAKILNGEMPWSDLFIDEI